MPRFRLPAVLAGVAALVPFARPAAAADAPAKPLSITVDGDIDAAMAPVAGKMTALFFECYPKLLARFENPDRPAPRHIRLTFVTGLKPPAQCSGDRVEVSVGWLRDHPDDLGMLTHELTHAVQAYPDYNPGWLTEGIADYARHLYGPKEQPGWSLAAKLTADQSYRDGYGTAAKFLLWLDARTPGAVDKLHRKMQTGGLKRGDIEAIAGRPLDALWDECVKAGGK